MKELLVIDKIHVAYGDAPILRDVSLTVGSGEIVGIVGESGSGKSTTIYSTLGILGKNGAVTSGSIRFDGKDLLAMSREELRSLRGSEISLIAQNPLDSFHPIRKVRSQVRELAKCHDGVSAEEAEERMLETMAKINLPDGKRILNSYAFEMSGGQCQRASIALGMIMRPKLLLADEPTSALDVTVQKQVVEELINVRDTYGTAILIVSHNMGVISHMADRVVVMYAGMIMEYGAKKAVIQEAMHPYTKNLIRAIPRMDAPAPRGVKAIKVDRRTVGCPYAKACPGYTDQCLAEMPDFVPVGEDHFVRCWHAGEV